jgi:hypothetical protein
MPCPNDIYHDMKGMRFKSKLDLTKGYWQIAMEPESVEKTAFVTPNDVYEFLRMPFGLKNSAATFNRLMRTAMGDLKGVGCFVDDICLFTETWEEHLQLLEEVFGRLRKAGLTIRPSKCMIGYQLVEFVGPRVAVDTLHPRPEKNQDLMEVQAPKSRREVRAFLAMAGYYSIALHTKIRVHGIPHDGNDEERQNIHMGRGRAKVILGGEGLPTSRSSVEAGRLRQGDVRADGCVRRRDRRSII